MVGHEPALAFRDARVCAAPENDENRDSALVTSESGRDEQAR